MPNETRSVFGLIHNGPCQVDQILAVPTGLAVGTNPPGLPSGDHRWENPKSGTKLWPPLLQFLEQERQARLAPVQEDHLVHQDVESSGATISSNEVSKPSKAG